jgi:hypothetical protein
VYEEEVSSARYEELSGVSKEEYERRLLRSVREIFGRERSATYETGQVESVTLSGAGEHTKLIVLFRVDNRGSDRRFGWRIAVWPASNPSDSMTGAPEDYASLFDVYLGEAINEIWFQPRYPRDDQGIEWLEDW